MMKRNSFYKKVCLGTIGMVGLGIVGTTINGVAANGLVNENSAISQMEQQSNFDLKDIFAFNGSVIQIDSNTAQLTETKQMLKGTISGIVSLDMNYDFLLDMDVNLGENVNGADGVGVAFHQGAIGDIGANGGGLGIRGLKKGIGFELDTYSKAPDRDDADTSFNHAQMVGAHGGFVSTDANSGFLTALAPMQQIKFTPNTFKKLTLKWNSKQQIITADYDGQHWELKNPNIDKSKKYTFTIGAATGEHFNTHTVRINQFAAVFEKPELNANDIDILQDELFDPFDKRINLSAHDSIDGDLTDKIKVAENNVDPSVPGTYQVTYEVKNSAGEVARKTITVTVKIKDTWPDGQTANWKMFSGDDIELVKDPVNALVGDYTFYADKHASVYKIFKGDEALEANATYRATVYFKPDEAILTNHHVKLSLKEDTASNESREIFNTTLAKDGVLSDKGYYRITTTFKVGEGETTPLINVENYKAGYIGSINISKVSG
jgi:hypothetical protein